MAFQLLALWAIVVGTVTWFLRDEKRRKADAALARAARYYAHAPQFRHVTAEPQDIPMPAKRQGGLSQDQRDYFRALGR